jgi:putative flavoprotein involved in K+ transport
MRTTETLIIGAGQAGLALSHHLTADGRDHVLLERGRVGERWRSERWDSLRMLTPNWMTRLPGHRYTGPDPDGFTTAADLTALLDRYAAGFAAPVETGTSVVRVAPDLMGDGYLVDTDRGAWTARNVVIATGAADVPHVPPCADRVSADVLQLTPSRYHNPDTVPEGGVLVVGASASGAQLAGELARAGRHVVLAVGDHIRAPRRYRGRDLMWWLDRAGVFGDPIDRVSDPENARRAPSFQLVGSPDHRDLDLGTLAGDGVRVVGRLADADGTAVRLADDLADTMAAADRKLHRTLDRVDAAASAAGLDHTPGVVAPYRPVPLPVPATPTRLDLRAEGVTTVLWATGYRRRYPWLDAPVLDDRGELVQRAGATPAPGLFVLGLRFQTRRDSNFIDGVGHDAAIVAHHIRCRDRVPVAA